MKDEKGKEETKGQKRLKTNKQTKDMYRLRKKEKKVISITKV